jgi:hypothetical protein
VCDRRRFGSLCYSRPECFYTIPSKDPCLPPKDDKSTKEVDEAMENMLWATTSCGRQETAYYMLRQAGAAWLYLEVTGRDCWVALATS